MMHAKKLKTIVYKKLHKSYLERVTNKNVDIYALNIY